MTHHQLILFLLQLFVLLAVALLSGEVARRLRQPAVLGELVGGILVGPTVFGAVAPDLFATVFRNGADVALAREAVIGLGLLFFLFVAGLEVDIVQLRGRGGRVTATSVTGIVVPFALGAAAVWLLPDLWAPTDPQDPAPLALFIGTALSISALPVIARILMDLQLMQKELGVIVMAAATINDILGWLLFAIILSTFVPDGAARHPLLTLGYVLGFAGFVLTVGRWAGQRTLGWIETNQTWTGSVLGATVVVVLIAGIITEWIGIHAILGAFLVGVALAPSGGTRIQAYEAVHQLTVSLFAPLYFASLGLKADFAANFDLTLVLVVILVASVGKVGGAGLGAWLSGMPPRDALAVGFGLNARGAMEVILASVALEVGLIDQRVFVALIVMAVVTSLLSGPMMQRLWAPAEVADVRDDRSQRQIQ